MVDSQFSPNACSSRVNLGVEKSVDTWCCIVIVPASQAAYNTCFPNRPSVAWHLLHSWASQLT